MIALEISKQKDFWRFEKRLKKTREIDNLVKIYKKRETTFIWNIYFGNKTRKWRMNEAENKSIRVLENSFSAGTYTSFTNDFQTLYQSCWKTFSKQLWEATLGDSFGKVFSTIFQNSNRLGSLKIFP